jgi:hypothetical protein
MAASNDMAAVTRNRRVRLGAIIAVAVAVAFVAWLILKDGDDNKSNESANGGPTAATVAQLRGLPTSVGHPVYWAGARRRDTATYELSRTSNGNIYIRYLPQDVSVGVPKPDYLTVGTYPFKNAIKALKRLSRKPNTVTRQLKGGGLAVANQPGAQNVYFAYPGEDVQVEVFHPIPGRALQMTTSGRIVPVG